MVRPVSALAAALLAAVAPAHAAGEPACKLCSEARTSETRLPLSVEVESGLAFSRLALIGKGDGEALIDPQTGAKQVRENMVDLGGVTLQGHARVTGEPFSPVRIEMPYSVIMHSPGGAEAELADFQTDLPSLPMLDANGSLEFSFGGRLRTRNGDGGNFRGRIPIRVDYN